ncbi:multiple coagulation factor deficiency protein 2 homolog [Lycorma delicatula]|uniref:multiple coagulation factor deficiency protein 2 homolog n=1 Tax=Lycorma delicatula TaxID=130591 RepID=UPI003F514D1E
MLTLLLLLKCIMTVEVLSMRGPHHPRGGQHHHHHYAPKPNQKITQDTQLLQDVEHIKEDLGNILSEEQTHKMTPEELEFHYFKLHDFDNNTKLDGLEILQAIHHSTHDSDTDEAYYDNKKKTNVDVGATPLPDKTGDIPSINMEDFQYFVDLIDQVLAEDDLDNDGYLSYIEYVVGRQKDQSKTNNKQKHNYK